ncbi:uncharacterized protein [Apostichopus japonicus]|uniref:uncharacterized protein isoform X3 n=1 Tax=Stichopus japonicus TaxID=307972 RepID=UPI003AB8DDE8
MSQRRDFRGRPDNRFRYNGPPGRGGRGGFNRPPGAGGFPGRRRENNMQQHGRQHQPPQNKPNVNEQKVTTPTSVGNKNASPVIKQPGNVQPLMQKDIPKPLPGDKQEKVGESPKGNQVNATPPRPNSNTGTPMSAPKTVPSSPAKTPTSASGGGTVRPGVNTGPASKPPGNQRSDSGFHGNSNNRRGSNQGPFPNQGQGGRNQGPNQGSPHQQGGRFGRGNQDRRPQQSRFSGPTGPGPFQGEPQSQQPTDFGDDLMTEKKTEKKFTGRCRLFIGNLPNETTDDEFKKLFAKFGEINEVFLNKQKMFGFIRLDTRLNAEAAKNEMDGATFKGRVIRVRFAAHGAALRVKNLSTAVSNELLEEAFALFGEVERAIVVVDDRGKSTGEGIIEFARKPAALAAIKKIKEGVFLLTSSTRPITVEPLEQKNDEDGLPEKNVPKNPSFYQEREVPPRFAQRNSFEFEWGQRWKQQSVEEDNKRAQLEKEIIADREKLMEEVELARHDYHTMQMRQELLHRQKELERLEEQRKDLEARRQGLQRQREDRFVPPGGVIMGDDQMMRQHQGDGGMPIRNEGMDMGQGMRPDDMNRRDGQRPSRFDTPGSGGGGFNGNPRGNLPPGGGMSGAAPGQPVGVIGGNFGGPNMPPGNMGGGGGNPRPLMDDLHEHGGGEFGGGAPKRPRRF